MLVTNENRVTLRAAILISYGTHTKEERDANEMPHLRPHTRINTSKGAIPDTAGNSGIRLLGGKECDR